jgi:hypothetical protein
MPIRLTIHSYDNEDSIMNHIESDYNRFFDLQATVLRDAETLTTAAKQADEAVLTAKQKAEEYAAYLHEELAKVNKVVDRLRQHPRNAVWKG